MKKKLSKGSMDWLSSEKKWVRAIELAKIFEFKFSNVSMSCGFCTKYRDMGLVSINNDICERCPLYITKACSYNRDEEYLFWKLCKASKDFDSGLVIKLCDKMLKAIRKNKF